MLSEKIEDELKGIVGEEDYLSTSEDLAAYSYDAYLPHALPDAVLFPTSTEEVSSIMKVAFREEIPVTPRGAGTNIVGGTVPLRGGIVLCLTKMNRIIEINPEDRYAIVEPGVVNGDFQREVAKYGLFYPPDPASLNVSTIGGNVAENAGGPRGVKYGVTRDYLLGLTVVLADGRIIHTGGKTTKNVTGYDLTGLFCGSEGTLGIITSITVKLIAKPEAQKSIQAIFETLDEAGKTVSRIMASGIVPVALELMDSTVMKLIEESQGIGLPTEAEGLLLIQVDGTEEQVEREAERVAKFCKENGAREIKVSSGVKEEEILWFARRTAFGVMARARPNCIVEDVTVPVSKLPAMVREITSLAARHGVMVGVLAHAGDGNMHPLILFDKRQKEEVERVERFTEDLFSKAVEMGGTLSGEHGIGFAKERFLQMVLTHETRELLRQIKKSLDPKGILNPGKFV